MAKRDLADIFSSNNNNRKEQAAKHNGVVPLKGKNDSSIENLPTGTTEEQSIYNNKTITITTANKNNINNTSFNAVGDVSTYESNLREKPLSNVFNECNQKEKFTNITKNYTSHVPSSYNNNAYKNDSHKVRLSDLFSPTPHIKQNEEKENNENFKREMNFLNDEKITNISNNYNISINLMNSNQAINNIHNNSIVDERIAKMGKEQDINNTHGNVRRVMKVEETLHSTFETFPMKKEELESPADTYMHSGSSQNIIKKYSSSYSLENNAHNWINNSDNMIKKQECNFVNSDFSNLNEGHGINSTVKENFSRENMSKSDENIINSLTTGGNIGRSYKQNVTFDRLEMKKYTENKKMENSSNSTFDIKNYGVLQGVQNVKIDKPNFPTNTVDNEQNKNSINIIFNNTSINNKYINSNNLNDMYLRNIQNMDMMKASSSHNAVGKKELTESCIVAPRNIGNSSLLTKTNNTVSYVNTFSPFCRKTVSNEINNYQVNEQMVNNETCVSNVCTNNPCVSSHAVAPQHVAMTPSANSLNDKSLDSIHQYNIESLWKNEGNSINNLKDRHESTSLNNIQSVENISSSVGTQSGVYEHNVTNHSDVNIRSSSTVFPNYCNMNVAHKKMIQETNKYLNTSDSYSATCSMGYTPKYSSNYSENFFAGYSGNCESSHNSNMVIRDSRELDQRISTGRLGYAMPFSKREEKEKEEEQPIKENHQNSYQNKYQNIYQNQYQNAHSNQQQYKNQYQHQTKQVQKEEEEEEEEEEEDEEDEEDENEEEDDRNGSSERDSSSEENSVEEDNVSSSKKEVYTLIRKTYNRIDMDKIPRPVISLSEKKSRRSAKIFETCEYISPPSCFQPYIAVDTGKANPKFIRSSLYQIPLFSDTLKLAKVPFGVILNPFARVNEIEQVDKVDMKDIINDKEENIEILRCPKCYGYLHANMLENITKLQHCVFCETAFFMNENVLFDIYQYNDKANPKENAPVHNSYGNISPLLKGSVDILLPPLYFNNNNSLKLTYTYLNKSVNQAATVITNKIKSITKQFSSTLDSYDLISVNKQRLNRIFSDVSVPLTKRSSFPPNENNIESEIDENVNSNINLCNNFKLMHELLIEKKGESEEIKTKRNNLLKTYPQMKKCLPPYFIFVVECSYNALHTNITHTILEGIRYAVRNVKCEKTKIAIITYSRDVYFYSCRDTKNNNIDNNNVDNNNNCNNNININNVNINNVNINNVNIDNANINNINNKKNIEDNSSGTNQMFVMSSVDDPFIPLPMDDIFFSCIDEYDKIDKLIDFIKSATANMQCCNSCGNSALKVAVEILKERNGGGSVCMFYASTPNYGIGSITELKKDLSGHVTEVKEKIFFDSILLDLYSYNISVDTFFISSANAHICIPSLQYLAQNTGGKILYIDNFIWQKDYKEIYMNIEDTLTSENIAYYCELKIRYSQHISIKNLFCCNNNFNSIISVDTIKIPKIRNDQTFAFLFNYFDMIEIKKKLYIQCACLYTNLYGERYVRLHTTHMNLTPSLSTVFRYTDAEALMNLLVKQLCTNILLNDNYVKIIIDTLADILFSYRVNCASSAHGGQLILPDTLKLLPLFVSCLLKHNVVKKNVLSELKVYSLIKLMSLPVSSSLIYIYPILYLIHVKGRQNEIDSMSLNDEYFIPKVIPTSAEKIYSNGIYLLDAAMHFYLYVGIHSDSEFTQEILGNIPTENNVHELSLTNSVNGQKMQRILSNLSNIYHQSKYIPLVIVPAKSTQETHLISLCVEDMIGKEYSYVNFLCFIHKLVHRKFDEA